MEHGRTPRTPEAHEATPRVSESVRAPGPDAGPPVQEHEHTRPLTPVSTTLVEGTRVTAQAGQGDEHRSLHDRCVLDACDCACFTCLRHRVESGSTALCYGPCVGGMTIPHEHATRQNGKGHHGR